MLVSFTPSSAKEGFYKDVFVDGASGVSSFHTLAGADSLGLTKEYLATISRSKTEAYFGGTPNDSNGLLLYPDNSPRFSFLFVHGGRSLIHGRNVGDKGRENIKKFYANGGSYSGSCAGANIASLDASTLSKPTPEPLYFQMYPGYTKYTQLNWVMICDGDTANADSSNCYREYNYTNVKIPSSSPLNKYSYMDGITNLDTMLQNGGSYVIKGHDYYWAPGTEILATYGSKLFGPDTKHQPYVGDVAIWAHKKDENTGRLVLSGTHPEHGDTGDKLKLAKAMYSYAIEGNGKPKTKATLVDGEYRHMNDNSREGFEKIGDKQYHHFKFHVNKSRQTFEIALNADDKWDMNLYARMHNAAFASNSNFKVVSEGGTKKLVIKNPRTGYWYIGVELTTTVEAVKDSTPQSVDTLLYRWYNYIDNKNVLNGAGYSIKAQLFDPDTYVSTEDSLKAYQDSVQAYQDSVVAAQAYADSVQAYQDSIAAAQAYADSVQAYQDSIAAAQAYADSVQAYQDSVAAAQAYADSVQAYQDSVAAAQTYADSVQAYQDSIAAAQAYADSVQAYQDSIAAAQAYADSIQAYIDSIATSQAIADSLQAYADSVKAYNDSVTAAQAKADSLFADSVATAKALADSIIEALAKEDSLKLDSIAKVKTIADSLIDVIANMDSATADSIKAVLLGLNLDEIKPFGDSVVAAIVKADSIAAAIAQAKADSLAEVIAQAKADSVRADSLQAYADSLAAVAQARADSVAQVKAIADSLISVIANMDSATADSIKNVILNLDLEDVKPFGDSIIAEIIKADSIATAIAQAKADSIAETIAQAKADSVSAQAKADSVRADSLHQDSLNQVLAIKRLARTPSELIRASTHTSSPLHSTISFHVVAKHSGRHSLELKNLRGQVIWSREVNMGTGEILSINTGVHKKGHRIFILTAQFESQSFSQRLILP